MKSKRWFWVIGLGLAALVAVVLLRKPFPPETTAEGAYLRLARAVADDKLETAFAYLEDDARDACYTVQRSRQEALSLIERHYPEPERTELAERYRAEAASGSGAGLFASEAQQRGWVGQLKADLSGIDAVESEGELATVVTARGTRYRFRRQREGGFGLTSFTAELVSQGNRAARDLEVVRKAAADFAAAKP